MWRTLYVSSVAEPVQSTDLQGRNQGTRATDSESLRSSRLGVRPSTFGMAVSTSNGRTFSRFCPAFRSCGAMNSRSCCEQLLYSVTVSSLLTALFMRIWFVTSERTRSKAERWMSYHVARLSAVEWVTLMRSGQTNVLHIRVRAIKMTGT